MYRIDEITKHPKLVQQIAAKSVNDSPVDMELNEQTQMLYVLNYERSIDVYVFEIKNYEGDNGADKKNITTAPNNNNKVLT